MFPKGLDIGLIVMQYACLLFSLCVHEAAHAFTSNHRGDPSARLMGRVSLNPLAHIDPIGTVVMPLAMMVLGTGIMFGWAKPVPFNPLNLKDMRKDPVWIALAGPASNFVLVILSAIALRLIVQFGGMETYQELMASPATRMAFFMIMINAVLMVFNLLPVPPLDGHHVLYYFLPPSGQQVLRQIGPYGILIAILLVSQFHILDLPLRLVRSLAITIAFLGL